MGALSFAAAPWTLAPISAALRARGDNIPRKAEAEMAAALHFLVIHALKDPEHWMDNAITECKAFAAAATKTEA